MPSAEKNREISESFFKNWTNGQSEFSVFSSGSTGTPKEFKLKRSAMIWSAEQTRIAFFSEFVTLHQLCCLPLDKIGALMQLVRSIVWKSPIDIQESSSNPLLSYNGNANIVSFTPMQLFHILENKQSRLKLNQFTGILIGGGELSKSLEKDLVINFPQIKFIHTFGMSETYSHFAGRVLGQDFYTLIPGTEIRTNQDDCLELRNFSTENQWLSTNDRIEIIDKQSFKWLGRKDFVINSGGIKIQLEQVEQEIQEQTGWDSHEFYCWYKPDERLGQCLVLITTNSEPIPNLKFSNPYFKPKETIVVKSIPLSNNGKILRSLPEIL